MVITEQHLLELSAFLGVYNFDQQAQLTVQQDKNTGSWVSDCSRACWSQASSPVPERLHHCCLSQLD